MPEVHPTAVIDPRAEIPDSARIGPYCVIEGPVRLGEGARLHGHNWLRGPIEAGENLTMFPFASMGMPPQHTGIDPDEVGPGVRLGDKITLREHATIHAALASNEKPTTLGDRCYMMSCSHVGHDCQLADDITIASNAVLGGHVRVDERAFISGNASIHQFCQIGKGVMVSGNTVASMDIPPYSMLAERNRLAGLNLIGMRRAGIPREEITLARRLFREVFRTGVPKDQMLALLAEHEADSVVISEMSEFVKRSTRGIAPGDGRPTPATMRWMHKMATGELSTAGIAPDPD